MLIKYVASSYVLLYVILHNRDNTNNTAVTNPLYSATSATTNKADMPQSAGKEYMHDITKCNDDVSKEQTIELKSRASSSAYQNIIQNLYGDGDDDVSMQSKYVSCNQLDGNVASNAEEMGMHSSSQKPSPEPRNPNSEVAAAPVTNVHYDIPVKASLQPSENDHLLEDATQKVKCDTAYTGENGYEGKTCQSIPPPEQVIPGDIPATS